MTTHPLPDGYRVQIVHRTDDTPPEIEGEWAVHCTLCKHVDWVETYDLALATAHDAHPATDRHQKWIGRLLVGGDLTPRRGYHCHRVDRRPGNPTFYGEWNPGVVPQWVEDKRFRDRQDDITSRRQERERRKAHDMGRRVQPSFHDIGDTWVTLTEFGKTRRVPAALFEVSALGRRVANFYVIGDGRCFQDGRLIGSVEETREQFTRAVGGMR